MTTPVNGDSLLTALVAGCSASGVTAFLSFPLDFLKVNLQLSNSAASSQFNVTQDFSSIRQIMTGSSALVTGSIIKNFARISSYNWASNFMAIDTLSEKKKTSAPRVVIAGVMSGFMETIWIVPFERIKTVMIQNNLLEAEKRGNPKPSTDITGLSFEKRVKLPNIAKQYVSPHAYYTSEVLSQLRSGRPMSKFLSPSYGKPTQFKPHHINHHLLNAIDALKLEFNKTPALTMLKTVRQMYALEGLHAFTAGTMITFVRQVGSGAAWFSTYSATRQLLDPHGKSPEPMWFSLHIGKAQQSLLYVVSACASVALTQPLDVVKSHIQLKNGKLLYKDSLSTAYKLVARRGFLLLYAGGFPRGIKIALHGSITALLYNYFERGINVLGEKSVFTD
ncbi:mitochondrial carrier [Metschnikowia bicuspidata var. bicuspidata NRRL YB-4993]|uniref:Mitochondrial carrier n=1 Tax=Metschnikowia bicuspidata var. bicuspidata NRRL YB-4993 TaxID=869754 RepID=A0A1A0H808_9ASCO|nr:mitochondrial carrier [Metschnikowia bicuspidata var. bicuspidata NRRL YB-4993]OBA20120.1 mitochondrial carrier [Metschnikowia bicuspidata var. bicuspidata NRRL YB-4993]